MLQKLTSMRIPAVQGDQPWDLREIINFLWRQWKFIAAFCVVALVLAALWLVKETPRYSATAQILLEAQSERPGTRDAAADSRLDPAEIESQMAIIRSSVFLRRVVERERLIDDPEFGSGTNAGDSIVGGIRAYVSAANPAKTDAQPTKSQDVPADVTASVEAMKNALSVIRTGQGYILSVTITSVDPARAARLANATADAYIVDKLDARFEAAKRASSWLSDRLVDLRKQLRQSEEAVATFRSAHGIPAATNVTLNQQQLSDLNARLVTARAEAAEKKARVEILESIEAKGGSVLSLPDTVANAGTLPSLQGQLSTISQREAELAARYSSNHPALVNVRAERRDVERAIATEARRIANSMRNEYVLANAKVDALEESVREVTGQGGGDNDSAIKLRELERTAAVNKTLFEDFLQRAKITEEQSTFEPRDARVISAALPPGAPSYPVRNRTFVIALFLGLLFGVGGAYAKERLNSGFTNPRQVEDVLELPLLASVSQMGDRDLTVDGKVLSIPLYPIRKPLSRFSESMRALRNGIQMADVDYPPKVLQLTSTVPSEGKTTIAMSLASSVATSGFRVLLIDADLRHPSASRILGLQKEHGLVDVLLGHANAPDVVKYQEANRIWTLPSGSPTQNPADLLGSERLKVLFESFRKSFDFVIVDTPPVGPVIDPIVLSNIVDKVLFVVKWGVTAREMVQHAIDQIPNSKKIAGIVFNNVDDRQAKKYGKYSYANYYGSRYYSKYYSG